VFHVPILHFNLTGWQLLLTGNVVDEQASIIESWDRRIIAGCTFWSVKYNSQLDQLDRNYYHSRLHFVHLDCSYYHAVMLYVPHLRLVLQFSSNSLILVILEYPYLDCIFVGIPESFPDNLRSLFHHSIHFLLWYSQLQLQTWLLLWEIAGRCQCAYACPSYIPTGPCILWKNKQLMLVTNLFLLTLNMNYSIKFSLPKFVVHLLIF